MSPTPDSASDHELVFTRMLQAPRELVYKAWTDPEHLAHWYGPDGFSLTTHSFDMRPGGAWRFIMHGPDGRDYPNHVVYLEIDAPTRIVTKHSGEEDELVNHMSIVTFDDVEGLTRVTMRLVFSTAEAMRHVIETYHADEGGKQTLGRLREYVASQAGEFRLERVLDAPRELVYKVWTQAEHLAKWWGHPGCQFEIHSLDLRPGGLFRYAMQFGDKGTVWGMFVYREIEPPERISFVVSFTDAEATPIRHPLSPTWPLEVLSTITFAEMDGKTLMTMTAVPIRATEEERATFRSGFAGMTQGWSGTLKQLEAYLATYV